MKILIYSIFFLISVAGSFSALGATTSTLTVNGLVTSATCSVDINGQDNATVTLPTVKTSEFLEAGKVSTGVTININFKNCTDMAKLSYTVTPAQVVASNTEYVAATGGDAKNIAFVIYDNSGVRVNFKDGFYKMSLGVPTNGLITTTNRIHYVSTDIPVLAGTVNTTLVYSISYN